MNSVLKSYAEKTIRSRVPLRLTVELLAPCNLKCPHCFVTHTKKNALTLPVLADLFGQIADAGAYYVTLTGGEIGLRKDLFEIIAEARKHYLAVKLLSSGTRWGPREWDKIADLGVENVRMSLYAMDPTVHDAVTLVPGSHAKTMATAAGLLQRGVEVAFSCPILAVNAHEVGSVMDYGERHNISVQTDPNITLTDRGDQLPKTTAAQLSQLVAVYSDPRVRKHFGTDDPCGEVGKTSRTCAVAVASAFVQCTGDVLPCSNWPRSAGNILHQHFLDIWRNSPEMAFARSVTRQDQTGCNGCKDEKNCSPCVAMNIAENGRVGVPSRTVCTASAAKSIAWAAEGSQADRHRSQSAVRPRSSLPIVA